MPPFRPGTELAVVVTDANGTTKTFNSNAKLAEDRPRGISFGTQLGSGFHVGGFNLRRQIDRDNEDVHLLDDVRFIAANGETAYEGFITEMPRSVDDTHTLSIATAGWMAHASDEPFTMIFVDRDLSRWQQPSRGRTANLVGSNFSVAGPQVMTDVTSSLAALLLRAQDQWASPVKPVAECLYDAGAGNRIARVYYDLANVGSASVADANWDLVLYLNDADTLLGTGSNSGDIWATLNVAGSLSSAVGRRYAAITFQYAATPAGAQGITYSVHVRKLAVYGDHGLTLVGTEPSGVLASDVAQFLVGRYAPLLDVSGIETTTWPIAHLVFSEDTTVYDALLKVNSYHLWSLAVWEDRKLVYAPSDLTEWDWEIRHDDVGNQIGLQGDSIENLRNGIIVQYTNAATGAVDKLHPDDHAELRDESVDNPANVAGRKLYGTPFQIPFPTTAADALELGRIRLLEDNQPKAPGSFTVQHHIKDRAGNYQPAWKVRAGDRIRLTSSVNLSDRPRLINETSYSHDSRSVTIGVDSTLRYVEGFLDRVQTSLQAAGLTS